MSHAVPRAVRLFDDLFGVQQPRRQPLARVSQNAGSRASARQPRSKCRATDEQEQQDDSSPLHLWQSPKQDKTRKATKKSVAFKAHERERKRDKRETHPRARNYPNCTKDSLLRAFEMANLPDFDAIAQHELNITVERPGRKRGTPVLTPPISQVLRVFDETETTSSPAAYHLRSDSRRSSQRQLLSIATPLQVISLNEPKFRRHRQAVLIEPILLSPDPEDCLRDSDSDSRSQSSLASTEGASQLRGSGIRSRNSTLLRGLCTERQSVTKDTFAVPVAPSFAPRGPSLADRSHSRLDDFKMSFAAGMTSTPLTVRKRGFLCPTVRPYLPSVSLIRASATAEPQRLRSSVALSTGWMSHANSSVVRSQLQAAGKVNRMICCQSSQLNETIVADREELRDTILTSFAAAFSTAKLVVEEGKHQLLSPRDKVLALCSPPEIASFVSVFTQDAMQGMKKIGEGSFGEIFASKTSDGVDLVWKLVPFNLMEDEETIFAQILPEVMILSCFCRMREASLNRTSNFISMTRAAVLRGSFPEKLLHEWDDFDRRNRSENPDPRVYKEDNLHLLMLLNHGGVDLEHFKLKSAAQAVGVFLQTAFSLAAAEAEFEFEHRDLHWGNILVRESSVETLEYIVMGCPYEVTSGGVEVSIIDFTLSRISRDGYTVYDDLSKYSDLFTGDASVDFQFEVYRRMRQANGDDWSVFCPRSNVLWLDYLLDKLLNFKKYSSRSKSHKAAVECLRRLRKNVLGFSSSKDLVESAFMHEVLNACR